MPEPFVAGECSGSFKNSLDVFFPKETPAAVSPWVGHLWLSLL